MDASCFILDDNADAVEFCPHEPFSHVLAAATYTLHEGGSQPNRSGSISLFSVDDSLGLKLIHQVGTVGIFDIKWGPLLTDAIPMLAVADAHGYLSIRSLRSKLTTKDQDEFMLQEAAKEKVSDSMCLCLSWNPSATSITVGLSDGLTSVYAIREDKLEFSEEWQAHQYEVWAASFHEHQPDLVLTGSDDCCFSCWDLRSGPLSPVFKDSTSHKMGVCSISSSKFDEHQLLTGSYDEFLRVWDLRALSRPVCRVSLGLGGGVWRVKPNKEVPGLVLAACMHNGFAIVEVSEDKGAVVVETCAKHGSLAYGADWKRKGSNEGLVVATCSFYDRLVRVWKTEKRLQERAR
ncbi:transducin/WD40 repeat-like superfamily protein isoform X2 [Wolffia australiana]